MGQFIDDLELTPLDDGHNWLVDKDFSYITDADEIITVPAGRLTDLASTPRFLWDIYPPFGKYLEPAVIHDELYSDQRYPKEKADLIFYQAMKDKGVWWLTRWNLYHAVKWFGDSSWHRHTLDLQKGKVNG